jgi:hypothetical protein
VTLRDCISPGTFVQKSRCHFARSCDDLLRDHAWYLEATFEVPCKTGTHVPGLLKLCQTPSLQGDLLFHFLSKSSLISLYCVQPILPMYEVFLVLLCFQNLHIILHSLLSPSLSIFALNGLRFYQTACSECVLVRSGPKARRSFNSN